MFISTLIHNFKTMNKQKALEMTKMAIPMLAYGIFYMIWFEHLEHKSGTNYTIIHASVDDVIPFIEVFIIPYVLWFFYIFFVTFGFIFTLQRMDFYRCIAFLIIGMTAFLISSSLDPTALQLRPETLPRDNMFSDMVAYLYSIDTPTNVTPSIHVYNSIGCFLAIDNSSLFGKRGKTNAFILSVLIICSTLFLKQHSVVDVALAFLLAVVSYLLVYYWDIVGWVLNTEEYLRNHAR